MSENFNVIIIGGGPGGYVAAIRLSQLGKKVLLVEKRKTLGGTCLNVGCIPSKALLDSTEFYYTTRNHAMDFGIGVSGVSFDINAIMERKNRIVQDRCAGIDFLMGKNKITRVEGVGKLTSNQSVEIEMNDGSGKVIYAAEQIILATGSVPIELPFARFNGKTIISSDEAIALTKVPDHLIIIGAGAIGLELGSVWNRLGAKVSIVEMMPLLFGGFDRQMANSLQRALASQGITFYMEHSVMDVHLDDTGVRLKVKDKKEQELEIPGDILLVAAGRKPYLSDLGLEAAGVEKEQNGRIKLNPLTYQTSEPRIYAIGDIINGPMLAHKAEEEGVAVAEIISGADSRVNYHTIASIVYTSPEYASVGHGEDQLKAEGIEYNIGRFLFKANARAHALNETEGMVKIISDKKTDKILGVHIIGPRASELIAEASLAMKFRATIDDIIHTVHAHPTLSEVFREAALDVKKRAIHS